MRAFVLIVFRNRLIIHIEGKKDMVMAFKSIICMFLGRKQLYVCFLLLPLDFVHNCLFGLYINNDDHLMTRRQQNRLAYTNYSILIR